MHGSFFPLALFFRGEHYTVSTVSHTSKVAATITKTVYTEHWAFVCSTVSFRSDAVATLFNSSILVKFLRQAVSDTASTRKRTAENTLFRALSYRHALSHCNPVTWQDLEDKRQEPQAAKTHLEDCYKHHLRRELVQVCFPLKPHLHSTQPF